MIPFNIGEQLLQIAFNNFKRENESERQQFYLDMSSFYFKIKNHMETVLRKSFEDKPFSKETLDNIYWVHDDIIDKIISRKTSGLMTKDPIITVNEKQDEKLNQFLYDIGFWQAVKEVYKRTKYFNTVIAMPVYDEEDDRMRVDIYQGDNVSVISKKNYLLIEQMKILKVDQDQTLYYAYWSKDEHYIVDANGNKKSIGNNTASKNPFGKILASICRDKIGTDFWGEPNVALYTYQMLHTMKLSDNERGEFYYKFPIGLSINVPFKTDQKLSPGYIMKVENNNPDANIDLKFIPTNTDWGQIRENESYRKESFMVNQKLPASSVSTEVKVLSGYAKTMDELELVEARMEDKTTVQRFAYDLLENTIIMAQYYGLLDKSYKIENITAQFQEVKSYETESDKWLRREKELALGMSDVIDFIMEDEDCSEDEAKAILETKRKRRLETKIEDKTVKTKTGMDLFGDVLNEEPTNNDNLNV